ncbi:MAG: P27 family phage terminase small subunit [Phycisphaeraceae bacterium]|nr:P27 family phage terminase small subunit [Phycisphaeraceae bacterium]
MTTIRDRVRELRRVRASDLRPSPRNWRTHPKAQQDVLRGVLDVDEMGVLTAIDGMALARYCTLWVQWVRAAMFVNRHGTTYPLKDGNGNIKCFAQFPEVAIVNKLSLALSRLEAEFGLTPSARTRINVPIRPLPIDAAMDAFFNGSNDWIETKRRLEDQAGETDAT